MGDAGGDSPTGSEPLSEPGDHPVDVPVTCVLSRFGVRTPRDLVSSYREYRRVVRDAEARVPGFLRAAFLVENPTTWYSLSLWADPASISHFGSDVPDHVESARRVFGRLRYDHDGPELWSTKWRLDSVSNNLSWPGLDLRGLITDITDAGRGHADAG